MVTEHKIDLLKGKPFERQGRKASGLSSAKRNKTAEPPSLGINNPLLFRSAVLSKPFKRKLIR